MKTKNLILKFIDLELRIKMGCIIDDKGTLWCDKKICLVSLIVRSFDHAHRHNFGGLYGLFRPQLCGSEYWWSCKRQSFVYLLHKSLCSSRWSWQDHGFDQGKIIFWWSIWLILVSNFAFFSNLNSNCSDLLDLRNLKEQGKKSILLPKIVLTFHCLNKLF